MKQFEESIVCCDKILSDYPHNSDVLFDKSCNLAMLSETEECLQTLQQAILQDNDLKIKAKKSQLFEKLKDNPNFQKMLL